jgi:hypothetical protein
MAEAEDGVAAGGAGPRSRSPAGGGRWATRSLATAFVKKNGASKLRGVIVYCSISKVLRALRRRGQCVTSPDASLQLRSERFTVE